jgi:hypothetical protein
MATSPKTRPSYSREDRRAYQAAYRAAGRDKTYTAKRDLPFVGVDGEGGDVDESGYHAYFLLSVGEQSLFPSEGNVRLTTRECLSFLCDLPRDAIYVVYFGDYDVTKWLEDLSFSKLEKLINRSLRLKPDGKDVWPVDCCDDEFQVDYLPRKYFKVRRRKGVYFDEVAGKDKTEWEPWLTVNDVGSFFQTRFIEAISKWGVGSESELSLVASGKEARGTFDISGILEIQQYNLLEIRLLQKLMERFRAACTDAGYIPSRWQGPGLLAEAMLAKHGVPRTKDIPLLNDPRYADLLTFARNAFYGGRPELMAIGPVDRPVHQWDINSAYPFAMQYVPCLLHGKWTYQVGGEGYECWDGSDRRDKAPPRLSLVYGTFRQGEGKRPLWYGLPVRSEQGSISYPAAGKGWYWSFEVHRSIHQSFDVEGAWVYHRECSCKPLAFVADVYEVRLKIGKDGAGIILKLGLNSLYGKQVQSIGSPKYANPIWGSFITATCRMMIQDFIHNSPLCKEDKGHCGRDILMVATDSVATWQERTDVEPSQALGGWSKETHPRGMFLVQPGLYFGSSGKAVKTRGVPRSVIETREDDFRSAFNRMVTSHKLHDGDLQVEQRMFVGIRYALHRHNLKLLGQWIEFKDPETGRTGKTIKFDWSTKRRPWPVLDPLPGVHSYIETFPKEGDPSVETVPYSKDIGGVLLRESLRAMFEGQPDWVAQIEPGEMRE